MITPDIAGLCERQLVTITHKLPEVAFLTEAARYFETRPTKGEDAAHWSNVFNAKNCREAADTLERQAAEIERLRGALGPFAAAGRAIDANGFGVAIFPSDKRAFEASWSQDGQYQELTWGDFRRAALTGEDHD